MSHPSWITLHDMAHSFFELDKTVVLVVSLVFCDCGFHPSALWQIRVRGLWKLPDRRGWLGETGSFLLDGAMFNKSLIQFSVDGWGCVISLLFDLRPNYDGGNKDNGNLLHNAPCLHCLTQCPRSNSRPQTNHTSTGDSWTLRGKSASVFCRATAPFSWVLVRTRFPLCPPRTCFSNPV